MVSVSTLDPGGWSDSFCDVMADVTSEKILLTDAMFWNRTIFPKLTTKQIKDDIKKLDDHFNFDFNLCETNNQGHMIISDLRNPPYNMKVTGITTSGTLKTKETIRKGTSLDKNKTVPWLMKFIEDGIIELPRTMTPGLQKGIDEIKNYGVSKSGKYEALTGHDDFISCLVILVHWSKRKMLRGMATKLLGVGGGDPASDIMRTPYDDALDAMKTKFQGVGMEPSNIDISFPS